jgi:hypothetical protein
MMKKEWVEADGARVKVIYNAAPVEPPAAS